MASVSADPLKAMAYRTGLQAFASGGIGTPSSRYYSFGSSREFSDFIVRFKKVSVAYSQTITEKTYNLKGSGDPGYDPDNPSSYLRYDSASNVNYTYNFVVTDSNYLADVSAGNIVTAAPFRQHDLGGETGDANPLFVVWEYNKYNNDQLEAALNGGSWSANELDSSGSTVSTASGTVIPSASGSPMDFSKQANSTNWFLNDRGTLSLGAFLGGSSVPSFAAGLFDIETGSQSDFESSARASLPSITGATLNDLFVGVLDGDFPDNEDFPSGPPKFRFTESTSITITTELYST